MGGREGRRESRTHHAAGRSAEDVTRVHVLRCKDVRLPRERLVSPQGGQARLVHAHRGHSERPARSARALCVSLTPASLAVRPS